jgi:uncharacterized protein (TIGR00299 family) protein
VTAERWLYVDASQGASGDMLLAALVDAGAPLTRIRRALAGLPLSGYTIRAGHVTRCGLRLGRVEVRVRDDVHGRGWREIARIVGRAGLPARVRDRALAVFRRLIEAEAAVHGLAPEKVHLHEAGGTDAIVDVVGSCVALELLGVDRVFASPITTGYGEIRCAHGVYPVPAPATARLVRGVPTRGGELEGERLTPTGAALVTTLADRYGAPPPMRTLAEGYGAGAREFPGIPNALRATLGEADARTADVGAEVVVIECTVDDSTPQVLAHAAERLLASGALDVFTAAVTMKKGRLGHNVTVLGRPPQLAALARVLLEETSTLGVRFRTERRIELERRTEQVRTAYGTVRMKTGLLGGTSRAWPEYDDCARIAAKRRVPLRDVQRAALAARGGRRRK